MNENVKILIVDDDPDVLSIISQVVQSEGYHVFTASSGAECRAFLKKHKPDLILLDVMLPDIKGHDLCREIKSDPLFKGVFILLISGTKISPDEQADGLDIGADGYITKPVSVRELRARIRAMVRILTAERDRDRLILELQTTLEKVKILSGLLPICAHCKKIRDDKGYWNRIEAYIQEHSNAEFSHGICPDCAKEHYPDLNIYDDDLMNNE